MLVSESEVTKVREEYDKHTTRTKSGQTCKRPIIFIAHNLGGIIVTSASATLFKYVNKV
jgi:hypothetical protein